MKDFLKAGEGRQKRGNGNRSGIPSVSKPWLRMRGSTTDGAARDERKERGPWLEVWITA